MLEKIEFDNVKTMTIKMEKDKLLQSRAQIRREAEKQKQEIVQTFEKMRRKGRIDRAALSQFGIPIGGSPPIREDPDAENEGGSPGYGSAGDEAGVTRN